MSSLLQVVNLSKSYRNSRSEKRVLNNISMDINKGKIYGIIGESGGGKTTLSKIIVGLECEDSGQILLNEKKVFTIRKRTFNECASIQYIFQDPYASLENEGTVHKILDEPVRLCKRNKRQYVEIEKALNFVGMNPNTFLNRKISTLSGGERQRVCIARALITKPDLIIADESTSMLHDKAANEIFEILSSLKTEFGMSILIITHSLEVLDKICDEVYVLHNGTIVEKASVDKIVNEPSNEYTRKLVNCMHDLKGVSLSGKDNLY